MKTLVDRRGTSGREMGVGIGPLSYDYFFLRNLLSFAHSRNASITWTVQVMLDARSRIPCGLNAAPYLNCFPAFFSPSL